MLFTAPAICSSFCDCVFKRYAYHKGTHIYEMEAFPCRFRMEMITRVAVSNFGVPKLLKLVPVRQLYVKADPFIEPKTWGIYLSCSIISRKDYIFLALFTDIDYKFIEGEVCAFILPLFVYLLVLPKRMQNTRNNCRGGASLSFRIAVELCNNRILWDHGKTFSVKVIWGITINPLIFLRLTADVQIIVFEYYPALLELHSERLQG